MTESLPPDGSRSMHATRRLVKIRANVADHAWRVLTTVSARLDRTRWMC
jgi:hypothetical protein